VLAVLIGFVGLRRPSPRVLLIVASAILLMRPLFETSDWAYFSMPGLVLAVVLAATTRRRFAWWAMIGAVVVLCAPTYGYTYLPHLNDWVFWLTLALVNAAVLAASARLTRGLGGPQPTVDRIAGENALRSAPPREDQKSLQLTAGHFSQLSHGGDSNS